MLPWRPLGGQWTASPFLPHVSLSLPLTLYPVCRVPRQGPSRSLSLRYTWAFLQTVNQSIKESEVVSLAAARGRRWGAVPGKSCRRICHDLRQQRLSSDRVCVSARVGAEGCRGGSLRTIRRQAQVRQDHLN